MFFIHRQIWPIWTTLWHYVSYHPSRIINLFFLLLGGVADRPPKDDVECAGNTPQEEPQHDIPSPAVTNRPDNAAQQAYSRCTTYIRVPGSWERRANPSMPPERFRIPETRPGEVLYISKGIDIAWGATARVERLPSGDVIKTPIPDPLCHEDYCQNMRVEARIYEKIGPHPRVPKITTWEPQTCCLTMEYLENGNLKEYVQQNHDKITPELRQRWAKQATEGLIAVHSADIIHCDVSPRNFLLDHNLNLKIADFGGASLSGSIPSAVAGTRFRYPVSDWDAPPSFEEDIFSLGSLIYFIMEGKYPYEDIPSDAVEKLYESYKFPNVTHLACGAIIKRCWSKQVRRPDEVYTYLEALDK